MKKILFCPLLEFFCPLLKHIAHLGSHFAQIILLTFQFRSRKEVFCDGLVFFLCMYISLKGAYDC